jgi:serine phosphatase RsbU (regulator of sigma subunit)
MTADSALAAGIIEWGVAGRTLAGQIMSGDAHLVSPFEGGVLVAVIDGLGHGPEAHLAASAAVAVLSRRPQAPVTDLIQLCHAEIKSTRGVVLSLASFDTTRGLVTWVGVGDVEGVLLSAADPSRGGRQSLLLRNGVVGYQLPSLREVICPVATGDMLIFATDGVRHDFTATAPNGRSPQAIADDIIANHGKSTDDALVLVARYLGASS